MKDVYYTTCPVGNASYVAVKTHILEEELEKVGVHPVKLQTLPLSRWVEHFTYENDRLFRDGGNTPPLWARSRNVGVKLIGLNLEKQRQVLLVRKDSEIQKLSDLKGKRLAVPIHPNAVIDYHKASAEQAYERLLLAAGLSNDDVTFVELYSDANYVSTKTERYDKTAEVKVETEALDRDEVDVIFLKLSTLQILLDTGKYRELYDLSSDREKIAPVNNEYPSVLTVSEKLAEEEPETVIAFVKATLRSAEWARGHKDEAEEFLAEQTFGDVRQYHASYESDFYRTLDPELSEEGLLRLQERERFLYDHGYLSKHVDVYRWADDYFLKEAKNQLGGGV